MYRANSPIGIGSVRTLADSAKSLHWPFHPPKRSSLRLPRTNPIRPAFDLRQKPDLRQSSKPWIQAFRIPNPYLPSRGNVSSKKSLYQKSSTFGALRPSSTSHSTGASLPKIYEFHPMKATRQRQCKSRIGAVAWAKFRPTPDSWPSESQIAMATDAIFCDFVQHQRYS